MKHILLSFLAIIFIIRSSAQDLEYDLRTVEVVSSRVESQIVETGKNIQVISSEMIEQMPVNSVDELLRQIPGLEISSRGGFGVQSDLGIRGATYNQVLVLIDGVRYNDPMTGHFNGYIPIGLSEIERIEVLKGPSSSIYGADAVGGVINIVTRMYNSTEDLKANVKLKAGSNEYAGIDAGLFLRKNSWLIGGSALVNNSKGELFANPNYGKVVTAPETYRTHFNLQTYSLAFGKEINEKWKAYVRAAYDDRNFNAKFFYTASPYDESTEATRIFFSQAKVQRKAAKSSTEIDLSYRWGDDHFVFNPDFTSNSNSTQYLIGQINQFNSLTEKWSIAYGVQFDQRAVESLDRGNHSDFHAGAYGQLKYHSLSGFNANISLRGDYDDNYGFELSPQLNFSYLWDKINLRGGMGRSVRGADYTERYISTNLEYLSSGRNIGNPDLMAESSWNFEAGADYFFTSQFKLSATAFYRMGSNLIDYVPTPSSEIETIVVLDSNGTYFYTQNLKEVNTFGVEAELWYKLMIDENSSLDLGMGYTYLDSKNSDPDAPVSKYVSSHANHLLNGNITYNNRFFRVGLSGLWKDRKTDYSDAIGMELKSQYTVLNAVVGGYFFKKRLIVDLEVMNIFDEQYMDILGAIMPGRWIIASLAYSL